MKKTMSRKAHGRLQAEMELKESKGRKKLSCPSDIEKIAKIYWRLEMKHHKRDTPARRAQYKNFDLMRRAAIAIESEVRTMRFQAVWNLTDHIKETWDEAQIQKQLRILNLEEQEYEKSRERARKTPHE